MRISWDDPGSKLFEAGVDRGVFYPQSGVGVPWNGLTSVKESVEGDGSVVTYIDGKRVVNQLQLGTFAADISAITYPDEMLPYDGYELPMYSGQPRSLFNLSYRSLIGNDRKSTSYGYRLHLIFNCLLTPSNRDNSTINEVLDNAEFEWKLSTTPVATPYNRPTSHFLIDSTTVVPAVLTAIENILYGVNGGSNAAFPTVPQLLDIFEANAIFTIVDNGDGTATITGPDDWVTPLGGDQVFISSPSFNEIDGVHILATSY